MAKITVTFSLDAGGALVHSLDVDGRVVDNPPTVFVDPGDRVSWTSPDANVVVSFPDSPFEGHGNFKADKGTLTNLAKVKSDVQNHTHFVCNVTLGDKLFENWSGVDTPGPNP